MAVQLDHNFFEATVMISQDHPKCVECKCRASIARVQLSIWHGGLRGHQNSPCCSGCKEADVEARVFPMGSAAASPASGMGGREGLRLARTQAREARGL